MAGLPYTSETLLEIALDLYFYLERTNHPDLQTSVAITAQPVCRLVVKPRRVYGIAEATQHTEKGNVLAGFEIRKCWISSRRAWMLSIDRPKIKNEHWSSHTSIIVIYSAHAFLSCLAPTKSEPSPLLLLWGGGRYLLWSLDSSLSRARVVDVVPCHVQEKRLDGDGLHLGRIRHQVIQINRTELLQTFHQRTALTRNRLGFKTLKGHKTAIPGNESTKDRRQSVDLYLRNLKLGRTLGADGSRWNGRSRKIECLSKQCQRLSRLAEDTV